MFTMDPRLRALFATYFDRSLSLTIVMMRQKIPIDQTNWLHKYSQLIAF